MKKIFTIRYCYSIVVALCFCVAACEPEFDVQRASNVTDSPILFQALGLDVPTKAIDVTTDNLTTFEATAYPKGTTSSPYFAAATFTGSGNPKVFSASGVNWSNTALDIYAYSTGSATGQLTKIDYKTFTITPAATAASQMDFVFGCLKGRHFAGTVNGLVPINFRHAESKICVNVKNSSSQYRFEVYGWKVCYLDNSATFTHDGSDTRAAGQLPYSCWSNNSSPSVSNSYESNFSALSIAASASTPVSLSGEMMLIPQITSAATAYQSTSASALPNGSYVAVKMKVIKNSSDEVVFSDGSGGGAWAIWPVGFNWTPGERFTYTIDLSKGAYYETNPAAGSSDLFAFDNKFVGISVTVGSFTSSNAIKLPLPDGKFAGLNIAAAPLYHNGTSFVIKDDDWNHDSYNSTRGAVNGSYFFNWNECHGVSGVSYKGHSDWRMPTSDEWIAVTTGSRSGSKFNGTAGCCYALIQLTGVTHAGNSEPAGLLLAPDGETMTGMSKTFNWNVKSTSGNTGVTAAQLEEYLDVGCVFLPASGNYNSSSWSNGGGSGGYWSSSQYSSSQGYLLGFGATSATSVVPDNKRDKASFYLTCRLVRTAD